MLHPHSWREQIREFIVYLGWFFSLDGFSHLRVDLAKQMVGWAPPTLCCVVEMNGAVMCRVKGKERGEITKKVKAKCVNCSLLQNRRAMFLWASAGGRM